LVVLTQRAEKDLCLRKFWIGGEGISSRDQYRSGRRENKHSGKWVSADWSRNSRITSYGVCRTVFVHVYTSSSEDKHVYTGLLKERCVHLGKRESLGSYNRLGVSRVCRCCLKFFVFLCGTFSTVRGALVRFEVI
jgi:hypothetical protein